MRAGIVRLPNGRSEHDRHVTDDEMSITYISTKSVKPRYAMKSVLAAASKEIPIPDHLGGLGLGGDAWNSERCTMKTTLVRCYISENGATRDYWL